MDFTLYRWESNFRVQKNPVARPGGLNIKLEKNVLCFFQLTDRIDLNYSNKQLSGPHHF